VITWSIGQLLELFDMKKYEFISEHSNRILGLFDRYVDGEVNIEEAVSELMEATALDEKPIRKMLFKLDRKNIVELCADKLSR